MHKTRLEAFTDGVMAIIITIMVLELKVPHGVTLNDLWPIAPIFLNYALSFVYIGIYWNNHHHLLSAAKAIDGRVLWANLHLLFWLSLVPFTTGWMGENHFATMPVALYGANLLLSGIAYYILTQSLIAHHGAESTLSKAIGNDIKGILSLVIYAFAIGLAFVSPWISIALYVVVAMIWFIPDKRIERHLEP